MARRQPPHKIGRLTFFCPSISGRATACDAKLAPISAALGAITMIARNRNRVLPKGKWRQVSTWDDGRINTLRGHYTVADGLITVMSQHRPVVSNNGLKWAICSVRSEGRSVSFSGRPLDAFSSRRRRAALSSAHGAGRA
jgi:hypothetical protein